MKKTHNRTSRNISKILVLLCLCLLFSVSVFSQREFEDRNISGVVVSFEDGTDSSASAQFELIAKNALGETYSAVRVRDALAALYRSNKIVSAVVEADSNGVSGVNLRFVVRRKTTAARILIEIDESPGVKITEQEILLKLNLLNTGAEVTERTLGDNASLILEYLREQGYFNGQVVPVTKPLNGDTEVEVTFKVTPKAQATIDTFDIKIDGFDNLKLPKKLKLKTGDRYSRENLDQDIERIRKALRDENYLAPQLQEPRISYDPDTNKISVELSGAVGPLVEISVDSEDKKVGKGKQKELLPIMREGTVDYATIIEGSRRLRNFFQEQGYFFADVRAFCSVDPQFTEEEASETENDTDLLCSALSGASLNDRGVKIVYRADLNRIFKLQEIRIRGTEKLTVPEIETVLESKEANVLGFIPYFGFGRGFTSRESLEEDRETIYALLRDLGYRNANVRTNRGVALNGEDLIITFIVDEGLPTKIDEVQVRGNSVFTDTQLKMKLPSLVDENYSRVKARNGVRKLAQFYSEQGYYDAKINFSIDEFPDVEDATEDKVRIVYNIENEGKQVYINRILINGNENTNRSAILKAINVRKDGLLNANDVFTSEQNLYSTDAFRIVEIKPEPAGESEDGSKRLTDIIINVEEQKPRVITYGGGFSSDIGANGFFDIRHYNLFGKLQQGGAQVRISRLRQLIQVDYFNPRFFRDKGKNRFAPLTLTAQYQRDSTVTRFFRSTFDQGTFGIVQRVDANGNPIDVFGLNTGDPTINRLSFSAETSRTLSIKKRSLLFVRYRFEDVRLQKFESLLVSDILEPDAKVRISGFGVNFVLDTRKDCNIKYTLLEIIAKGEKGAPCRYNSTDPTHGNYVTAEYNISLPTLGANVGFHKFQASYNTYYTFPKLKNTTIAARGIIGLASVFSRNQAFQNSQFPDLEGILPISERFFAGGSNTLRGFNFEGAGPRVVIVPEGTFRNSVGAQIFLDPFTIPFGGNGLAVVNVEARIPIFEGVRAVPFYDGGNVFRRVGDIFNPPDVPADDVFQRNLRALWTNTLGIGIRIETPVGGEFGIDYGYLLNPPEFLIPQQSAPNAIYRLKQGQIHFRFSQAF